MPTSSRIDATDMFCGAGGSSTGFVQAGGEVALAMNHWDRAIETHNTNHPNTTHILADISNANPRRYPHTRFLISSPECTNHSLAKGKERKNQGQMGLWENRAPDAAEERSRCTMWDPLRFAEYHRYECVIMENVADVRSWVMFEPWVLAWKALGYAMEFVYFNSMFAWPTPQSRDRIYIVAYKQGNPKPDLSFTPLAYCGTCRKDQQAVQSWKNPMHPYGKYGRGGQYLYRCPQCAKEVLPYYYAAANAIDWSVPITRIGDRKKPLEPKTMNRIQLGLDRQINSPTVMNLSHSRNTTGSWYPVEGAYPTQITRQDNALVLPYLISVLHATNTSGYITPMESAYPTQTTTQDVALVTPYIVEMHGTSIAHSVQESLATVCAGGNHHYLVTPDIPHPFLVRSASDPQDVRITPVGEQPMPTLCSGGIQHGLVVPEVQAYLMQYSRTGTTYPVTDACNTMTTRERHALVLQERDKPRIEDCGFRMLRPHEIKAAMAFPREYVITGGQKEQVKQLGNAVTPPVLKMIAERCIASLDA